MRFFTRTPANVRVAAIGLAVLAHVLALALLSIERRSSRREPARELLQFVSVWPDLHPPPIPPQPAVTPQPQSARAAFVPRAIAASAVPPASAATVLPLPSPQPAAKDVPAQAPVDWVRESQKAAERFVADSGRHDTFSKPPNTDLPAKLCAPRKFDAAMQALMDEVQPPPPDPSPPPLGPQPGVVMLPGGVRVGVLSFGIPVGKGSAPNKPAANMKKRPRSSVPDPHNCDEP